jgi:hypothetical protein
LGTLLLCTQVSAFQAKKKAAGAAQKLSRAQIEQLVAIGTPDDVIAQEIRLRGLAFTPAKAILDSLREKKTGPQVLQLIAERIPKGTLIVVSDPPECEFTLDGVARGKTDARGRIVFDDLEPGEHELIVRKARYGEIHQKAAVEAGRQVEISAKLEWAVGFLTVNAGVADALIQVNGVGESAGPTAEFECPPGPHSVTISANLRKPVSETVDLAPGVKRVLKVSLEVDKDAVAALSQQALEAFRTYRPRDAREMATRALALNTSDANAAAVLAMVAYGYDDFHDFVAYALRALQLGGEVAIPVKHRHLSLREDLLHPASLIVSATRIEFRPEGRCTQERLSIRPADINRKMPQGLYLTLEFKNPADTRKTIRLVLADRRTTTRSETQTFHEQQMQAPESIEAIRTVLERVLDGQ